MAPASRIGKKKASLTDRRKAKSVKKFLVKKDDTIPSQRRKKRKERLARYIYYVFRQVNPDDLAIGKQAMIIMENFLMDIFEKLAAESSRLVYRSKRRTMTDRDIDTAVKLLVPGELGKHASNEGRKAVIKYTSESC